MGIIIAILLNIFLREVIFIESENALDFNLTSRSIALGVSFGFLTPFVANYFLIKSSMSNNLRNSLDITRSTSDKGIGIKIERLE